MFRYLSNNFFKTFLYCVLTFIAVLMTTRIDDIARIATMGPGSKTFLFYILYQIPYILPIAIPVSCLISSILLMQRLSVSHELTALRAAGLSIRNIITPILLAGCFLSIANFFIISELATRSHLSSNILKKELQSINPLLLLRNKQLMQIKGFYFDALGQSKLGEFASDVIFASSNKEDSRINVMFAKDFNTSMNLFHGKGVTIVSSLKSEKKSEYDPMIIENIGDTTSTLKELGQFIDKKVWRLNNDYLTMPLLLVRIAEEKHALTLSKASEEPRGIQKNHERAINRGYSEIVRRVSVGFAVFVFTLLGATFGISISRNRSQKSVIYVICLASFYLCCFFSAQGLSDQFLAPALLYTVPLVLIVALSVMMLRKIEKGIE